MEEQKYDTVLIGNGETFIVGFGPGRQRKKDQTLRVWEGNRSGDLMQQIIKGVDNLFLTNAQNWYVKSGVISDVLWENGFHELQQQYVLKRPKKIIAFGKVAAKQVKKLSLKDGVVVHVFEHPSYVLRFNKDVDDYVRRVREVIV